MERNTVTNSVLAIEDTLLDTSSEDFLWTNVYATSSPSPQKDKQFPFFSGYSTLLQNTGFPLVVIQISG